MDGMSTETTDTSSSRTSKDNDLKLDSKVFTKLSSLLRTQYLSFLEEQLEENVFTWQEENAPLHWSMEKESIKLSIQKCAKFLEDFVIKKAIIKQLYHRAMIKLIAEVRHSTKKKVLVDQMAEILKSNEEKRTASIGTQTAGEKLLEHASATTQTTECCYSTKEIQTENEEVVENVPNHHFNKEEKVLTLDERIDLFQSQLKRGQLDGGGGGIINEKSNSKSRVPMEKIHPKKRRRIHVHNDHRKTAASPTPLVWHSPTPPPPPPPPPAKNICAESINSNFDVALEHDEIAQELDKIFTEQEPDLDEIFGIATRPPCSVLNNISSEQSNSIQKSQPTINPSDTTTTTTVQNNKQPTAATATDTGTTSVAEIPKKTAETAHHLDHNPDPDPDPDNHQYPAPVKDLRYSLWPCECFMQKKKLSAKVNQLIEEDIRWHDILKWQFSILFDDDDSFDDFATCSPSLELNDVLKNSCMRRISPWVVRHLMKPFSDGFIGNRYLFKKLAKKLADHIITENQYPDEYIVKSVIEDCFCLQQTIMTIEDLNNIQLLPLSNYDE